MLLIDVDLAEHGSAFWSSNQFKCSSFSHLGGRTRWRDKSRRPTASSWACFGGWGGGPLVLSWWATMGPWAGLWSRLVEDNLPISRSEEPVSCCLLSDTRRQVWLAGGSKPEQLLLQRAAARGGGGASRRGTRTLQ